MKLSRREMLRGSAVLLAISCDADGTSCRGEVVTLNPPPEPTTPPGPAPAGTSPFPGLVRPDGNVRRRYARVGQVPVPVEWSSPEGDVRLALEGTLLVLTTARDGTRTIGALDLEIGETRELVDKRLGPSVLLEARDTLARAT